MSADSAPIVVLGASTKPDRPSHIAVVRWAAAGHPVWPVHPSGLAVAGHQTYRSLQDLPGRPELVTMYVNPQAGMGMVDEVVATGATKVWLNPGAGSAELEQAFRNSGLEVVQACNLVALTQGDPLADWQRWAKA